MIQEIHKAIKDSNLSVDQKKYVMQLVFQDVANKEVNAIMKDLEVVSKKEPITGEKEAIIGEGAE